MLHDCSWLEDEEHFLVVPDWPRTWLVVHGEDLSMEEESRLARPFAAAPVVKTVKDKGPPLLLSLSGGGVGTSYYQASCTLR